MTLARLAVKCTACAGTGIEKRYGSCGYRGEDFDATDLEFTCGSCDGAGVFERDEKSEDVARDHDHAEALQ